MLEEYLDDTHLCIKCSTTIIGLENYIRHRKTNCVAKNLFLGRDAFGDFHEPNEVKGVEKRIDSDTFNFNYDLGNHSAVPETTETDKSVRNEKLPTENLEYNYDLGADVFFSSLQLQSSTKRGGQNVPKMSENRVLTRKAIATIISHQDQENEVDWITPHHHAESEKFVKSVSGPSDAKKVDSMFELIGFHHDSAESSNDDDEEVPDYDVPARTHTGGKWKPEHRPHGVSHNLLRTSPTWDDRHHWDIADETISMKWKSHEDKLDKSHEHDDPEDYFSPPPNHTKGKWVPGSKILKLDYKPEPDVPKIFNDAYWCSTCNRKLASLIVYERHLKSNLHLKRSMPENELEEASRSLATNTSAFPKRLTKPSIYLNTEIYTTKLDNLKIQSTPTDVEPEVKVIEDKKEQKKKRKRRKFYTRCDVCKTRLPTYLLGKHLISHYHYRRMHLKPEKSFEVILNNMEKIILQSPFQCQPCKFYANSEETFMLHWNSSDHAKAVTGVGKLWCSFCKFECQHMDEMTEHLMGSVHQEVILVINRSFPIIIRQKTILKCSTCYKEFRYNLELRKHGLLCDPIMSSGTASNSYQSKFICSDCGTIFNSRVALQKHGAKNHAKNICYCSPCNLTFNSAETAKKHRTTTEHKICSASRKPDNKLTKKCGVCGQEVADIIKLKQHLQVEHPDSRHCCPQCGENFLLPQEVSRHIRDKKCKFNNYSKPSSSSADDANLAALIIVKSPQHDLSTDLIIDAKKSETDEVCFLANIEELPTQENFTNPEIIFANNSNSGSSVVAQLNSTIVDIEIIDRVNNLKWLTCSLCSFTTSSQAEHVFHEILHKAPKTGKDVKIACTLCNKSFRKASLRCHLRQHTNERIFQCELCIMSFTRKSNLKDHLNKIHLKNELPLTKGEKVTLMGSTSAVKEFICSICTKVFSTKYILDQHSHVHRDRIPVKRFRCHIKPCQYSGRSVAELNQHLLLHTNEKSFQCQAEGCNYRGKSLAQLKRHNKKHGVIVKKDLLCEHCDFKCQLASHLKRHLRIHTGEKPYQCPHCNYSCNNSENLRKHVLHTMKHKGRSLYECKYCNEFSSNFSKDYKAHLTDIHNIIDN